MPRPRQSAICEAARLAGEVGPDLFGFGWHHTRSLPVSSPTSLVNAAAASTRRIKLGTTVTVLSTDDPVRVVQQLGTVAVIAPCRIDPVAGREWSSITFPIFEQDERDYDMLLGCKLELEHWAQYGRAYREALSKVGHPAEEADIAVAVHGFVGEGDREAKATHLEHEARIIQTGSAEIGNEGCTRPGGRC